MYFLGIDIGKRQHEACLLDSAGKQLDKSLRFSNTQSGGQKLVAMINRYVPPEETVLVGMEATGHYWLALHTFLRKAGFIVEVFNPIQTDALRNLYIRQTKTDSKDCYLIAELIRFGRYTQTSVSSEAILGLRQLTRYRVSLIDNLCDVKRRVVNILDTVFPEYETLFSDTFGKTSSELLLTYSLPEEMLAVDTQALADFLAKHSRNRLGRQKAEQIQAAAQTSFGADLALDAYKFQLRQLLEQVRFAEEQLSLLEEQIELRLADLDKFLVTLPGVGPILAASILAEIGDISRFSSPKQLVAFAGLDPSVKQSGQFVGTKSHLSKRGSPYLRRAIWLAAKNAYLHDPLFAKHYNDLISRGKDHMTIIGAASRKLTNIIFAVLRDQKPYSVDTAISHIHQNQS